MTSKIVCTIEDCEHYIKDYDCKIKPKCINPRIPDVIPLNGYFLSVRKNTRTGIIYAQIYPPEATDARADNYTFMNKCWQFELKEE